MRVWVFLLLSTDDYISEQGGIIVDAVLLLVLVCEI